MEFNTALRASTRRLWKDIRLSHLKIMPSCCLLELCLSCVIFLPCQSSLFLLLVFMLIVPSGSQSCGEVEEQTWTRTCLTVNVWKIHVFLLNVWHLKKIIIVFKNHTLQMFSQIQGSLVFVACVVCFHGASYSDRALLHIWRTLMSREGCQDAIRP